MERLLKHYEVQSLAPEKENPNSTNVLDGENDISDRAMLRCTVRSIFNKPKATWISRVIIFIAVYTCIASYQMLNHKQVTYAETGENLPIGLKYILLWNDPDYCPFCSLLPGQESFIRNNCSVTDCYVTDNKNIFGGDLSKFDAIAFNGRTLQANNLPITRYPHQKYIFFQSESADNYPVCDEKFDGFFNWTATYKLNSDIPYTYFVVKDNNENIVGPKINIHWNLSKAENEDVRSKLQNKSKAAAWFVSNCKSRSKRLKYVDELQKELNIYGLIIDVFGNCGNKKCPRKQHEYCNELLQNEYYFYLAMENSFSEDYVTEKVLRALQNYAMPIVYGGANYSKFLPPSSYVPARSPRELAMIIYNLIENPDMYFEYFRWHSYYSFHSAAAVNECALCEILNNIEKFESISIYDNFRSWWNPNYKERCDESHTHPSESLVSWPMRFLNPNLFSYRLDQTYVKF